MYPLVKSFLVVVFIKHHLKYEKRLLLTVQNIVTNPKVILIFLTKVQFIIGLIFSQKLKGYNIKRNNLHHKKWTKTTYLIYKEKETTYVTNKGTETTYLINKGTETIYLINKETNTTYLFNKGTETTYMIHKETETIYLINKETETT